MIFDPEKTRSLQEMLFHTAAGESLRELFYASGHFGEELGAVEGQTPDQARIERDMTLRLMDACGIELTMQPRDIQVIEGDDIDET